MGLQARWVGATCKLPGSHLAATAGSLKNRGVSTVQNRSPGTNHKFLNEKCRSDSC